MKIEKITNRKNFKNWLFCDDLANQIFYNMEFTAFNLSFDEVLSSVSSIQENSTSDYKSYENFPYFVFDKKTEQLYFKPQPYKTQFKCTNLSLKILTLSAIKYIFRKNATISNS